MERVQNFYVFTIKPWIVLPTFTFSPHNIASASDEG